MRHRQIAYIVAAIVIFAASILLSRLPKSESYILTGIVTAKGTAQGYGPSGDKLRVDIGDGNIVPVYVHIQMGARVGDSVQVSGYDRYFFSPKYQLLKVVRE